MRIDISVSHSFSDPAIAALFAARCKALFEEFNAQHNTSPVTIVERQGSWQSTETAAHSAAAGPERRAAVWGAPPRIDATGDAAHASHNVPIAAQPALPVPSVAPLPIAPGVAPHIPASEPIRAPRKRRTKAEMAAARAAEQQPMPPDAAQQRAATVTAVAASQDVIAMRARITELFTQLVKRPNGLADIQSVLASHKCRSFGDLTPDQMPPIIAHFERILRDDMGAATSEPHTTGEDW